ncbi:MULTISPECIES: M57 family metalloprotease [unclassified Bradyrhizobium]|uniref:M12 family metallopeptidase n=1 Tax=unclassified Bradyrhizobium TaxID=2631580 RepID=UPI00247981BA|nr:MULTISPECIES: M57 family metalloprotease [unclassified Bradyrhizobium]WGR73342.1 M57 family metalloprotease [Bradyrhizobium sp. ISRA426]WGR78179.1 M57 family metalloprotease [Bradyrhizobium sp. ISRA430]WGR88580.1 M57 family metalloprotease [Bradyrhizobium sp. ISRA432]
MFRLWLPRLVLLLALSLSWGANAQPALPSGVSEMELYGTVIRGSKWDIKEIPVCWENLKAQDSKYADLVRKAVAETWETAAQGGVRFSKMWPACTDGAPGVHVRIADEGAHTDVVGKYLDGKPSGMTLNFSFNHWSKGCRDKREFCIRAVAVHEFGHALGFTHEQNRDDAPEQCRNEKASGSVGDYKVTKYDPNSIMNYCNSAWNGNGQLSPLDIAAVRTFYPS